MQAYVQCKVCILLSAASTSCFDCMSAYCAQNAGASSVRQTLTVRFGDGRPLHLDAFVFAALSSKLSSSFQ